MKQITALKIMNSGKNVFLTGPAGSGKTYVLNEFIKLQKRQNKKIAITATTGLAASHMGGTTIHSWSGISIYQTLPNNFFSKLPATRKEIIQKADVLIIDEISMMHDFRLDMVNEVCKNLRQNNKPFGGLQVILCGDFFQLPPVNRNDGSRVGGFSYKSMSWEELDLYVCYLDQQFRQNDDTLIDILNSIRNRSLSQNHIDILRSRIIKSRHNDESTSLYTNNIDVEVINSNRLKRINSQEKVYQSIATGDPYFANVLQKSILAPKELRLKIGALVMSIKNSPKQKYFNGSIGTVKEFDSFDNVPIVKFLNGTTTRVEMDSWELRDGEGIRASISQIPLRLAWAITIHKSQGMTLESAIMDLGKAFESGMGYVALSRVRALDKLFIKDFNDVALSVSDEALSVDQEFRSKSLITEKFASKMKS